MTDPRWLLPGSNAEKLFVPEEEQYGRNFETARKRDHISLSPHGLIELPWIAFLSQIPFTLQSGRRFNIIHSQNTPLRLRFRLIQLLQSYLSPKTEPS